MCSLTSADYSIIRDELGKSIDNLEFSESEEDINYMEYLQDIRDKADCTLEKMD